MLCLFGLLYTGNIFKWVCVLRPHILSMDIVFLFYREEESIISLKIKTSLPLKSNCH